MSNEKKHKWSKYSLEFNQDAATLVLEKGYSQPQAADHPHLALCAGIALASWRRKLTPDVLHHSDRGSQ